MKTLVILLILQQKILRDPSHR